ncbi:GNAT family N-acetyltransferase [Euzebya sp.]|uniref:GNAT family N-acetyltransferase n=1 Tax=Euzebya sp. TaxID=1971409 RepID=UPI0035136C4C
MRAPLIADLDLERIAALGWQAPDTAHLGGWLLRAAGGFTGRANSVLPLGDPGVPLDDALDQVRDWYARRGLSGLVVVPEPSRSDLAAALADRGATDAAAPVAVMVAPVDGVRVEAAGDHDIEVVRHPEAAWLARFADYRGVDRLAPVVGDVLTRGDVAFGQVKVDGEVVGIGRAAVAEGWVGLTAVSVDGAHRRRGIARAVAGALVRWGAGRGGRDVYVQVTSTNEPALGMWRRLGFVDHHTYRYLTLPGWVSPRPPPTGRTRRRAAGPQPPAG